MGKGIGKKKNSRMTMRQDHDVERVWPKKGTVNHTVLSVNYVSIKLGIKE